ncbi:hypothetical protein PR202_ga00376 [Eleusine coracana subsp. coracana]|uniref:Uncharacterized protein n=1 Tax=Eleusine coracana subsp. coracana TaxID=191504 RepID=A0AAV5BGC4_ELECO|nr:hypothetical protein PR202_ga00376 [Eleusine coracana subsp. coracana]
MAVVWLGNGRPQRRFVAATLRRRLRLRFVAALYRRALRRLRAASAAAFKDVLEGAAMVGAARLNGDI